MVDPPDKAITPAMRCFNELWGRVIIAQCFANLTDSRFKDSVADEDVRPHIFQKILFCDKLAGPPEKMRKYREGFWRELDCP